MKTDEDVLDDKGLVVALKDAKAKVFEILNDLNIEKKNMTNYEVSELYSSPDGANIIFEKQTSASTIIILQLSVPAYQEVARKMKNFTKLLDLLRESDASCVLPKTGFIELIDDIPEGACDGSLQQLMSLIIKVYFIASHVQMS